MEQKNDDIKLLVHLQQQGLLVNVDPINFQPIKALLEIEINYLINSDFQKLIQLLYRLDISENKLKELLQHQQTDSGSLIAELIIERQLEKLEARRQYKQQEDIPDDERW